MEAFDEELRLLFLLVVNIAVLLGAWRIARRFSCDVAICLADTLGLWYLWQYIVIGVLGLAGGLSAIFAGGASLAAAGGLWWAARRSVAASPAPGTSQDRPLSTRVFIPCLLFLVGWLFWLTWQQRYAPVMAYDAMAYHLPVAAQWLQTGRLGIFEPWFHTPANAYSPLAGSMFSCWLMLPLHNDLLARYVQQPALMMLFCCLVPILRRFGLGAIAATIASLGIVLARPFASQAMLPKDDLFAIAFFAWALLAIGRSLQERSRSRVSAFRLGVALGLMLATKYTILLSLPMFLLCADLPWKLPWRWREWVGVCGYVLILAGPWFCRNAWLTGNPLYPSQITVGGVVLLPGLFKPGVSPELTTAAGAWRVLLHTHFSPTVPLAALAGVFWLIGLIVRRRDLLEDPLLRLTYLGPLVGVGVFVALSPYSQVRFAYPAILLWFAAACVCAPQIMGLPVAIAIAMTCAFTAFSFSVAWPLTLAGGMTSLLAFTVLLPRKAKVALTAAAAIAISCCTVTYWTSYVIVCRRFYPEGWETIYGPMARGWSELQHRVDGKPHTIVAYTGVPQVYGLYGFRLNCTPVYVPVSARITTMRDVPPSSAAWSEDQPPRWWVASLHSDVDASLWLRRLRDSKAEYLFIGTPSLWSLDPAKAQLLVPPELNIARQHPELFRLLISNGAAYLYQISVGATSQAP